MTKIDLLSALSANCIQYLLYWRWQKRLELMLDQQLQLYALHYYVKLTMVS